MSRYKVYVRPRACKEINDLPGHVRQRVRRAVDRLADDPCPPGSKKLELSESEHPVYRLRIEKWRILYCVVESDFTIDVLAARKRPPYDYGDIKELLNG